MVLRNETESDRLLLLADMDRCAGQLQWLQGLHPLTKCFLCYIIFFLLCYFSLMLYLGFLGKFINTLKNKQQQKQDVYTLKTQLIHTF